MIVLDAHQDIAYNYLKFDRDYRRSALVARTQEPPETRAATIGLPEALAGRVAVVFSTLFVAPVESDDWKPTGREKAYSTPQEAYSYALEQMDYYERMADETDKLTLIKDAAALNAVLAAWGPDAVLPDLRGHVH